MGASAPAGRLTKAGRLAALLIVLTTYLPWWAQRRLAASKAPIRVVVAGRQSGKTHAAAELVVRALISRPGSQSCLLMPTYKSTKGPLKHLRRALLGALGPPGRGKDRRWFWKETDKCFELWNGSELYVRTADDKEGVPTRGLTIDGILWVDEAAYVPRSAWEAARLTQSAVADPLVLITTTPCGRNWVWEEFNAGCPGPQKLRLNESFRFRTEDSPYHNPQFVADLRVKLGPRRSAQELDAEFLGDAHAAFDPEHVAALFVAALTIRGSQFTLGVDLGKEQDYTVVTLMNEFGETWVLGRWRDMEWPAQEERIVAFAKKFKAIVVVAMGAGGGYGGMMASRLKAIPEIGAARVLEVQDASMGVRGELFELLIADVQARRLKAESSELGLVLRHELTFFEAHRQMVAGRERWKYHGPEGVSRDDQDEENEDHDDAVLSFALANWGRVNGWSKPTAPRDLSAFARATTKAQGKRPPLGGGGRIFGLYPWRRAA